jgi:glycerophosphoryl diester phosphodiesterase
LLLGHRGARPVPGRQLGAGAAKIPPENTIAAFEYALASGCDGFEFDVRLTRDERMVVCHNASLAGLKVDGTSFDSLCAGVGETLACLEDVLATFGGRAFLNIEVKVRGGEELIVEALRRAKPQQYLLSSFLPEVLLRFHGLDEALPLGYVCDRAATMSKWRELPIQVLVPCHDLIDEPLVVDVHECGRQMITWTVNQQDDMRRLAAWGVDGLISDDPRLLQRTFQPATSSGQKPRANS